MNMVIKFDYHCLKWGWCLNLSTIPNVRGGTKIYIPSSKSGRYLNFILLLRDVVSKSIYNPFGTQTLVMLSDMNINFGSIGIGKDGT